MSEQSDRARLHRIHAQLVSATDLVLGSGTLAHGMAAALPPAFQVRVQQQIDQLDEALRALRHIITEVDTFSRER